MNRACHVTVPEIIQAVADVNTKETIPFAASSAVPPPPELIVEPAIFAVVTLKVIVTVVAFVLITDTTSPSANVLLGTTIDPPEPTCTYFPTSPTAKV